MIKFLREVIRAKRSKKSLPDLFVLLSEYFQWRRFQRNDDVFKNAIPWITFSSMNYLKGFLKKDMKVFEYGGGGSTLFFAKYVGELVTVEHDKEWFNRIKEEMSGNHSINWRPNLIFAERVESTMQLKKERPGDYFSANEDFSQFIFRLYAAAIDQYPEQYFDVVLVDGRARPSCMFHSLMKVKVGGLLILDNSDRSYYMEALSGMLGNYQLISNYFGPTPYLHWFTQTNIWKRMK
jgi:hypothetical protein